MAKLSCQKQFQNNILFTCEINKKNVRPSLELLVLPFEVTPRAIFRKVTKWFGKNGKIGHFRANKEILSLNTDLVKAETWGKRLLIKY